VAQAHGEPREKYSPFDLAPADIAATAMKRFEDFAKAQTEQFDNFRETNREWLDRVQAETNLASEFVSKLTTARSIPDAMTAYQEWGSRRLEMMADDTKHLMDNTQKFMQTSAKLLANGWLPKGPRVSG
jgi:phasin protein